MEEKVIRVECTGADIMLFEQIVPLQNDDFKTLTPQNLKRLKSSIIAYGISSPTQVYIDEQGTAFTLDGRQRLRAYESLKSEGWTIPPIPIVKIQAKDKDEAIEKLLAITSSYGDFNSVGVQKYMLQIKNTERIKHTVNLSGINLDRVFAVLNAKGDPDEIPTTVTKETIVKQGDVWLCGRHKITCGDSRDKSVIDRLGVDHYELCLTDPPFGISYTPTWRSRLDFSDNRKAEPIVNDHEAVFDETFKNINSDVVYAFHASTKCYEVLHSFRELDYELRATLVWVKQSAPVSMGAYRHQFEPVFYLVKKGKTANWVPNDHSATTVITCKNQNPFGGHFSKNSFDELTSDPDTRTEHACQKPTPVLSEILRHHTAQTVIDPFIGSGSTMIACQLLGKACMGIELFEPHVDLCLNRYLAFTGESPIRESDGKSFVELKAELQAKEGECHA